MTPFTDATPPAENPRATVGGNRPPITAFYAEQNESLPKYLADDNADLTARVAELTAAFARAPVSVTDDDLAGKVSDFIAQVAKCAKAAEAKRVDAKAGPLTAGRLIDGFYQKQILEKLDAIKRPLTDRLTVYERAKAAEERRRREESERLAREEAARAAAEAEQLAASVQDATGLDQAIVAEDAAQALRATALEALGEATAPAAQLSTVRGEYGSSSSLRTTWKGRIIDRGNLDLEALRPFLAADALEKAVGAYVNLHKDTLPLRGVEIYQDMAAVVRG